MTSAHGWPLVLCALWLCIAPTMAAEAATCQDLVAGYRQRHGRHFDAAGTAGNFVFFLHVPRTAGKTYSTCFLRSATPPSKRCAPSYDLLRLNVSQEGCIMLTSHDDYSITEQLPENASVITQLRKPVDRVVSSYEFAIEVAARRIHLDDAAFYKETKNTSFVNTLNVWPWSYLVPWFRHDMQTRMAALKAEAEAEDSARPPLWEEHWDDQHNRTYFYDPVANNSTWEKPAVNATLDPYNNALAMPLHEWIESDIAQELIHEGAALQILGITNYSYWQSAEALRRCFFQDAAARAELEALAAERLAAMAHVGLTEQLDDSVVSMASELGHRMDDVAYKSTPRKAFTYDAPGFDPDSVKITYNSTTSVSGGEHVTLTVLAARQRLARWAGELRYVESRLRVLEPQLEALVDKEDAWLDDQEAKYVAAEMGAMARVKAWLKGLLLPTSASAAELPAVAEHEVEPPKEPEPEEEEQQVIVSPWSEEIEELDAQVFKLQTRKKALQHDTKQLEALAAVRGPPSWLPEGRARLVLPNDQHVEATPLGLTYQKCSKNASSRAANKRRTAFKHLRTPWEESFAFSSVARRRIAPETLARIEALNGVDQELWGRGKAMLEQRLQEQREAGILEALPPLKPPAPAPRRRRASRSKAPAAAEAAAKEKEQPAQGDDGSDALTTSEGDTSSDESHEEL